MAKKSFDVTIEQVNETVITMEASNKRAAENKAIRKYREDNKFPTVVSVGRTNTVDVINGPEEENEEEA